MELAGFVLMVIGLMGIFFVLFILIKRESDALRVSNSIEYDAVNKSHLSVTIDGVLVAHGERTKIPVSGTPVLGISGRHLIGLTKNRTAIQGIVAYLIPSKKITIKADRFWETTIIAPREIKAVLSQGGFLSLGEKITSFGIDHLVLPNEKKIRFRDHLGGEIDGYIWNTKRISVSEVVVTVDRKPSASH